MTQLTEDDLRIADELFGFDGAGNRTRAPSREAIARALADAREEAEAPLRNRQDHELAAGNIICDWLGCFDINAQPKITFTQSEFLKAYIAKSLAIAEARARKGSLALATAGTRCDIARIAALEAELASATADLDEARAEIDSLKGCIAEWKARHRPTDATDRKPTL